MDIERLAKIAYEASERCARQRVRWPNHSIAIAPWQTLSVDAKSEWMEIAKAIYDEIQASPTVDIWKEFIP